MARTHAVGTLLLLGAVLLSLNALAVSARPGEFTKAETSTTSNSAVREATGSVPNDVAGSPVANPGPVPIVDPVPIAVERNTLARWPSSSPSASPSSIVDSSSAVPLPMGPMPSVSAPAPGQGVYQSPISSAPSPTDLPRANTVRLSVTPIPAPVPPVTPSSDKAVPGTGPPYGGTPG